MIEISEQERGQGLKPELFARILNHYNRSKLPDAAFLKNALQKSFAVDASLAEECATVLVANAKFCGLIQDISGSKYVRIVEGTVPTNGDSPAADLDPGIDRRALDVNTPAPPAPAAPASPAPQNSNQPRKIFVAHGKNRKPLDALKKVLDQFKIPYVVAVDEPHKGRPISAKVAQLMSECSAGIFIFTKDEKFLKEVDGDGPTEVYRPSENVVYELGAASVMWDRKIIILREDGVNFPSDFSDLGYPKMSGRFYIQDGYIYGPSHSGQYYIQDKYIYGPKGKVAGSIFRTGTYTDRTRSYRGWRSEWIMAKLGTMQLIDQIPLLEEDAEYFGLSC